MSKKFREICGFLLCWRMRICNHTPIPKIKLFVAQNAISATLPSGQKRQNLILHATVAAEKRNNDAKLKEPSNKTPRNSYRVTCRKRDRASAKRAWIKRERAEERASIGIMSFPWRGPSGACSRSVEVTRITTLTRGPRLNPPPQRSAYRRGPIVVAQNPGMTSSRATFRFAARRTFTLVKFGAAVRSVYKAVYDIFSSLNRQRGRSVSVKST